jgi:hypothetical protein
VAKSNFVGDKTKCVQGARCKAYAEETGGGDGFEDVDNEGKFLWSKKRWWHSEQST